ncbi:hypothetical protein [Streptomyces sp. NRRL B-24484]|uniref:hypothetical protein n=1 Tax=Streptomyces sp. NRRL B-24484 TaxID=1463833 RepID=UPI0004C184EA|nr:hypothetical protein [Streptomyces sp. NRRL B-24484]
MLVLMLFMPPALLGALLLLGRFEERLTDRLTTPPPDEPAPSLHESPETGEPAPAPADSGH